MKLKKATKGDLDGFIKLEKEFKQHNESLGIGRQYKEKTLKETKRIEYKKDFENRLKQTKSYFYFAKDGNNYIGYIYGNIKKFPAFIKINKYGYLDAIIVGKKSRGKGVASLLKKAFFNWLKRNNINICQIHVASVNKDTIKVYKKWGFIEDEIRLYKKLR
jgi:GNAT superfamily N-acetyltransferase